MPSQLESLCRNVHHLPVLLACLLVIGAGTFLLSKAAAQARDTTRKHHLADIERSLYFARDVHGSYPPYDQPSWCGRLSAPENREVREAIETSLRAQNAKYHNVAKPFPGDPRFSGDTRDYFYWKHSPALFELYAVLEAAPTGERTTSNCPNQGVVAYDYGLTSVTRDDVITATP